MSWDCYSLKGYSFWRFDRTCGPGLPLNGGGVAVYFRERFDMKRIYLDHIDGRLEYICVLGKVQGLRLCVCVVYKPPNIPYSCFASLFHALFIDMLSQVDEVILMGDFNVDLLGNNKPEFKYFRNLLASMNLAQIVNEPTRETDNTAALIDHIIVRNSLSNMTVGVVDTSKILDGRGKRITDHKLVFCDCPCKTKERMKEKFISYRELSKVDLQMFSSELSSIEWHGIEIQSDVDDAVDMLTAGIMQVFDACAPLVKKRVTKRKAPWRNSEIMLLTCTKNQLKKDLLCRNDARAKAAYSSARNKLNYAVRKAKKDYFAAKLKCSDSKSFWATLRAGDLKVGTAGGSISVNISPDEINRYFAGLGGDNSVNPERLGFYKHATCEKVQDKFQFRQVSESEVKNIINSISTAAFGIDGISIIMVRAVLLWPIPLWMEKSLVIPLPKNSNPTSVSELRPISILPVLSKVSTMWFRSYLIDRTQVTRVNDRLSGIALRESGVPQGLKRQDKLRIFEAEKAMKDIKKKAKEVRKTVKRRIFENEEDPDDPAYGYGAH
ncbi:uncharacterized protein LOC124372374 [Homalodisca vitripennis]|uniref:uncharacterized protein LOC124372374 n=1 Tax=Homalodisca vitripennis TaxID=197043 RepID=UPI001EEB3544|nr:uncharacterized protein LOC124372374 [Homalodisca vitripennis]